MLLKRLDNPQLSMDQYKIKRVTVLFQGAKKHWLKAQKVNVVMLTGKEPTVLVVEDDVLLRMDIVMSLEDQGFTVFQASNADQAIEILDVNTDIVLMFTDIDMPGSMDGLKLAIAVRDRWPPIKIIVTSGHSNLSDTLLPIEGRFFSKPYDHARVANTMLEMLAA
jgi:DNA-binding NtrC family response regulator